VNNGGAWAVLPGESLGILVCHGVRLLIILVINGRYLCHVYRICRSGGWICPVVCIMQIGYTFYYLDYSREK
jgi:hypothetical protein